MGSYGLVWGVTDAALPLPSGGRLTLRVGGPYYYADLSRAPAALAAGKLVYAQVDSAAAESSFGAVLETHERDGGPYNNITTTTVPAGGVVLPQASPALSSGPGGLPQREVDVLSRR